MAQIRLVRPTYAERFRCIGSECEDTCCQGWTVPIDQAAHERYQGLPESPLRRLIDQSVERVCADGPEGAATGAKPGPFAQIRMNEANQCPLLTGERLCRIHAELGEGMLSQACSVYPRIVYAAGELEETALTLSCPEAARLVLLSPDLLDGGADAGSERADAGADQGPIPDDYWAIRETVFALVRDRSYPLWQRLFLLGVFCRRLDLIARGELKRTTVEFVRDFEAAVGSGSMRAAMDRLPLDGEAQLDVVLRLAGLLLHRSNVRPRFVECVNAFTAGIGNGPGATLS